MNLFGVEIKHPSPKELGLATFIIVMFLVFSLLDGERADSLFPRLAAVSAGVISASFGISLGKGWRAWVLLLVITERRERPRTFSAGMDSAGSEAALQSPYPYLLMA